MFTACVIFKNRQWEMVRDQLISHNRSRPRVYSAPTLVSLDIHIGSPGYYLLAFGKRKGGGPTIYVGGFVLIGICCRCRWSEEFVGQVQFELHWDIRGGGVG